MPDFGERLRHEILNPGDMLTADNASALKRVPIGSLGQVWTVLANGQPGWAAAGGGVASTNFCLVQMSVNQAVAGDGLSHLVNFDTPDASGDPSGMLNAGAHTVTIPATDIYQIALLLAPNSSAAIPVGTELSGNIDVNGVGTTLWSSKVVAVPGDPGSVAFDWVVVARTMRLLAGDVLSVSCDHDAGAGINAILSSAFSFFTVARALAGPGSGAALSNSYCHAYLAADHQNIALTGLPIQVLLDTAQTDPASMFDAANHWLTVPATDWYDVSWSIDVQNWGTSGYVDAQVGGSATGVLGKTRHLYYGAGSGGNPEPLLVGSTSRFLQAAERVRLYCINTSDANPAIISGSAGGAGTAVYGSYLTLARRS